MDSIMLFHKEDILLESKTEAYKVRRKAFQFWLSNDQKLYKRSFYRPYLLCIHLEASVLLSEELHEGICGSHMEVGPCLTEPSLRGIGGWICRRKRKSIWKSV